MVKVITFGEIMLRLSPENYDRFIQANRFEACYGGSEANVAISLSNYGINTSFVTKLSSNELGQSALNTLRKYGVNTNYILRDDNRLGIYYHEKGASQRPSKVVYDRKYSSISLAEVDDFNWDAIFGDVDWFHFSGITPALSNNLSKIILLACKKAKEHNITVSCDLNYRAKLWTTKQAKKVMSDIIRYVDVCIANEEDIEKVFSIKAENTDVNKGLLNYDSYVDVAKQIHELYGCKIIACTFRTSLSASDNKWASMLYYNNKSYQSKEYHIHLVDRVGGGDSFVAGLIYGLLTDKSIQDTLEFATAASCLKQTINGDYNLVAIDEVENLAEGNSSGRVQR